MNAMKKILCAVVMLLMVSASHAQPALEHRSLEEALNPDGTLKRGVQGSFNVKGYTMRTGANPEHRKRHVGYTIWLACAGR